MAYNESLQGVSTCYVFKSRLQEYAQKVAITTPVYETIKEGPSHEPTFRSTVIVNDTRYDSLPGFFNRKAAEQSAAEVALMNLPDSGTRLSQPVHETGLCKNLLQDYAQKMNFAIPLYECRSSGARNNTPVSYSCTVKIGGMEYIGGEAKTKKEAEIKAARTALLAIQSSGSGHNDKCHDYSDYSAYTVIPFKKNVTDLGINNQECAAALKPKKNHFKKKKRRYVKKVRTENAADTAAKIVKTEPELHENAAPAIIPCNQLGSHEQKTAFMVNQNDYGTSNLGINRGYMTEVSVVAGVGLVNSAVDRGSLASAMCQGGGTSCLEQQTACATDADQGRSIKTAPVS